ncbi:MAG: hypothetical protein ACOCP8_09795, partial [archaeon]
MYDQKISEAKSIIEAHNQNVEEKFQVDVEKFISNLQNMGGTTSETIRQCSWEDIEKCGVPRLIAKQISYLFRKGNNKKDDRKS